MTEDKLTTKVKLDVCVKCEHFGKGDKDGFNVYMCFLNYESHYYHYVLAEISSYELGRGKYHPIPEGCPYTLEHTVSI